MLVGFVVSHPFARDFKKQVLLLRSPRRPSLRMTGMGPGPFAFMWRGGVKGDFGDFCRVQCRFVLACVYSQGTFSNRSDRKSTRLNSSHLGISYAVFCL